MKKLIKYLTEFALDVVETTVIALSIFIVSFLLIFQLHEVKGQSMDGAAKFHDGQRLITDKITYRFREPARGEVIIFRFPRKPSEEFIKRIIGLPNESIEIKNGAVYIYNDKHPNGFKLDESDYLDKSVVTTGQTFIKEGKKIKIPDGKYVVMGDNRSKSYDSRSWGFISRRDIVGRSILRYWPPNEIHIIGK